MSKRLRLLGSGNVRSEQDLYPVLTFEENVAMLGLWGEIVQHYARRYIIKPSDRLPAFSGIAGAFGSTGAHGAYHAGLWETWFVHMLLWYVDAIANDGLLPNPFTEEDLKMPLAPSWSWAKLRGAWNYRRKTFSRTVLAERVDSKIHLVSEDQFSAVHKSVVTLKGLLIKAKLRYKDADQALSYAERFQRQKIVLAKDGDENGVLMWPDFVLDPFVKSGEEFACMVIQADGKTGQSSVVLQAVEGREPDLYRRIGIFSAPLLWLERSSQECLKIC